MSYLGPYKELVEQALNAGAVYVYVCAGKEDLLPNLAADLDPLAVDPDVVRGATLPDPDLLGFEFSRHADVAPLFGHAEAARSRSFGADRQFSAEIICRRTTSFSNSRFLAGLSANGGGLGLVCPSGFRIGVNGEVAHGLLTHGNPNNQLALGTALHAQELCFYTATWDGLNRVHSGYRDGMLQVGSILGNDGALYDPAGPRGIAIGGCPTLGTKNADCVVEYYALYPVTLTADQAAHHAKLAALAGT